VDSQRGTHDSRHEAGPALGRALLVQAVAAGAAGGRSTLVDRLSNAPTRAATSSGVGVPRTTLTSGSSFIDVAYDEPAPPAVTRVPQTADQLAVARQDRVFSA
jgi:hypothetical protein